VRSAGHRPRRASPAARIPLTALAVVVGLWLALAAGPAAASERGGPVALALREALQLAVERGIGSVGRPDGFLGNDAIRIGLPSQLDSVESALRMVGQQSRTEKFVASLNRAAEQAAPAARAPLQATAAELLFGDASRVLAGADNAATEVLRRHGLGRAITALNPAVADAMDKAGAMRRYKRFVKGSQFGGLLREAPVDLEAYVVGRTVEGIFHAIAQEERRIRTDPAARTTPRLREVFGAQR
jgi:hypothetical protein